MRLHNYLLFVAYLIVQNSTAQPLGTSATGRARYQQIIAFKGGSSQAILETELLFNGHQSLYSGKRLTTHVDSSRANVVRIGGGHLPDITVFKDENEQLLISREYVITQVVTVRDSLPALAWVLGSRRRQIGPFTCQDATAPFRGRVYTAWFALQLPVAHGPWKLGGLPGLIVEATDADQEVEFRLIAVDFPLPAAVAMPVPELSESMSYGEYRKKLSVKLENLRKMTQGIANSAANGFETAVRVSPGLIERSAQ